MHTYIYRRTSHGLLKSHPPSRTVHTYLIHEQFIVFVIAQLRVQQTPPRHAYDNSDSNFNYMLCNYPTWDQLVLLELSANLRTSINYLHNLIVAQLLDYLLHYLNPNLFHTRSCDSRKIEITLVCGQRQKAIKSSHISSIYRDGPQSYTIKTRRSVA